MSETLATVLAATLGALIGSVLAPWVGHVFTVRADERADARAIRRERHQVQREILFDIQRVVDEIIGEVASALMMGKQAPELDLDAPSDEELTPLETPTLDTDEHTPEQFRAEVHRFRAQFIERLEGMYQQMERVSEASQHRTAMSEFVHAEIMPRVMALNYASERVVNDDLRAIVRGLATVTKEIGEQLIDWPQTTPPGMEVFAIKRSQLNQMILDLYLADSG
jgi:hypothetical protein